jgi:hypothetical protein
VRQTFNACRRVRKQLSRSSHGSHGTDVTNVASELLQRVNKPVRAAEVNDAVNNKRRRINSAESNLLIGCQKRRFTPVGMKKKRHIELSIAGKYPTVLLLGLLDFKISQQIARFGVARFQRAVQHADENGIATDYRRRKHVRFSLLAHDRLVAVCVNNVV